MRQFAGEFEIHLTVRLPDGPEPGGGPQAGAEDGTPAAERRLRAWAAAHGLKYTHIVLDRGRTPRQPMVSRTRAGTLTALREEASGLADGLAAAGFAVVRTKIEAAPWNQDVPGSPEQAVGRGAHEYFEHHVKVVLGGEAEVVALARTAAPHGGHVSRNARRVVGDGRQERFVTQRCRGVGRPEAAARLAALVEDLTAAGHRVVEVEEEYVVHDDNLAVDAGWAEDDTPAARPGRGEGAR
ncbi:hypothetical protein [Allostreptomyces psammosilenae]|uniref:Ankyrin n=1 Tax=Allostreptomyces psammosilenae TaxID=1892865 RepID=A0A852ZQT5_9ACTN|nr:hypothetical protein [Allostreptomyces psammosilenae]NYI04115.1 hypothetical protein [Allostreptomyces psammosilenae]